MIHFMFGFSSWAASLVSKIFQEKNLEILVSQHAEDRGTTDRVTHKHPTELNPSAKPLESSLPDQGKLLWSCPDRGYMED
jgi:hypothetical protein